MGSDKYYRFTRRNFLLKKGRELRQEKEKSILFQLSYLNNIHCVPPLTRDQVNTIYNMVFYRFDEYPKLRSINGRVSRNSNPLGSN
jgi:hypothetical protein